MKLLYILLPVLVMPWVIVELTAGETYPAQVIFFTLLALFCILLVKALVDSWRGGGAVGARS